MTQRIVSVSRTLIAVGLLMGWWSAVPAWAVRAPDQSPEAHGRHRLLPRARGAAVAPGVLLREFRDKDLLPAALPGNPRSEDAVVSALLQLLRSHPAWLGGVTPGELELHHVATVPKAESSPATVYVQFTQEHGGLDLEGTYAHFSVTLLDTRSVLMSAQAKLYPHPALPPVTPPSPAAFRAQAAQALGLDPGSATLSKEQRRFRYLEGRWRRVSEIRFNESLNQAVVDEESGDSWIEEDRVYATIQGRVRGRGVLFDPGATGPTLATLDLKDLRVATGTGAIGYTDATGAFDFPTQTSSTTVSATLDGRWAAVASQTSPDLNFNGPADPGVPVEILFNPTGADELPTAQVNGYYHTTAIHDWVQERLPSVLVGIDSSLPVNVNLADTCNAFYDFASINFYRSGGGCLNTAYDTIIYHEYGHFVDDQAGGLTDGGLSEGWGDVLAAYGTNQPLIGEGFFGPGTMVRTADNTYQYPPNGQDEVHALGQAWAGFAWDLRNNLIASQGSEAAGAALAEHLVIPVVLANSPDIPSAAFQVLVRDDDDGNLANGTPHKAEIVDAANQHSIPLPEDDFIAPASVNDLTAQPAGMDRITLTWTSTGDDGQQGTAARYDIRYAGSPMLTDADFQLATQVAGAPNPAPPGSLEQMTVVGLLPETTYHWAMKVLDNVQNASVLSNPTSATTTAGVVVFAEDFESGAPGWTTSGLWHLSTARANSPITSQAYNDGVDYETGATNSGALVSPPIDLTAAIQPALTIHHWFQIEDFPQAPFDVERVQISTNGGAAWITLQQWDSTMPSQPFWSPVVLDLAGYAGQTVRLRFFFDTVDEVANAFEGWFIDDVMILAPVPGGAPVLDPIGDRTVPEGQGLSFMVSATDPNGDVLSYSAANLPTGATFANQTFSWTPDFTQAGSYSVTFTVSDGSLTDSETLTVTVQNVNRPPVLAAIGDKTVTEGALLSVSISATDPDGDALTYSATPLPAGAALNGQSFNWTPGSDQAGSYLVTFTATDGQLADSETITITVLDAPAPPATPTGLVATAVSKNQINLSWTDVATETRFELQRSPRQNFNQFVQLFTLGANVTTSADTGLKSGTTYYYRLRACNLTGCSAYTPTASAKTPRK